VRSRSGGMASLNSGVRVWTGWTFVAHTQRLYVQYYRHSIQNVPYSPVSRKYKKTVQFVQLGGTAFDRAWTVWTVPAHTQRLHVPRVTPFFKLTFITRSA
jgi:hypothetical protein